MSPFMLLAPAALLCGIGRRIAGGAFQQWTGKDIGDLPVRIFFGLCLASAAAMGGLHDPLALGLIAFAGWLGTTAPMFSGLGFGRNGVGVPTAVMGLVAHGAAASAGISVAFVTLLLLHHLPPFQPLIGVSLLISALAIVPAYWGGWAICGRGRFAFPEGFQAGSELGEFMWGASMGLGCLMASYWFMGAM